LLFCPSMTLISFFPHLFLLLTIVLLNIHLTNHYIDYIPKKQVYGKMQYKQTNYDSAGSGFSSKVNPEGANNLTSSDLMKHEKMGLAQNYSKPKLEDSQHVDMEYGKHPLDFKHKTPKVSSEYWRVE